MEVKKKVQSNGFYLTLFQYLKDGKTPSQISKEFKISKQNINYYLRKLKDKGLIKRKGYGVWEITGQIEHTLTLSKKTIRGHAFIWKVKTKEIDWSSVLKKAKIDFKLVRNCIPRAFINQKKVWFGKNSLTIYEPNSFYGENAIESRKYAWITLRETIQTISNKIGINLFPCEITPAREHFALIKNDLAKQVNRDGDRIYIRDSKGEWMWMDMSDGVGELETGNHNALVNNIGVQKWWNDMKETKFEVTPKFILNSFGQMIQVQQMNSDNIVKHQKVLDEMLITLKAIRDNLNDKK
jgi:DNA-binding transcriptional ArsR family regulator